MNIKQLWAPWRMEYIEENKPTTQKDICVFCSLPKEDKDRENLIVARGVASFVILNKYPYNNGHVMVVPHRHTNDFSSLSAPEKLEMQDLLSFTVETLKGVYKPQGFNLGMNLGEAGGAGIREHLHWHAVPRWNGDTNFMPVLADTKSMPQHLFKSYDLIEGFFKKHFASKIKR